MFYYSKTRNSGFFVVCLTRLMIHRARSFFNIFFQQFFLGGPGCFFFNTFCVGKSLKFFMAYREKNGRDSNFLEISSKKRSKMGLKLCFTIFAFLWLFSRKRGHFYMTTEGYTLDFTRWDFLVFLSKKKTLRVFKILVSFGIVLLFWDVLNILKE